MTRHFHVERRFYWFAGKVDRREVSDCHRGHAPAVWDVPVMLGEPASELFAERTEMPFRPVAYRVARFRRRDYGYTDDFIGPHRDSDYHEEGR